MLKVHENIRLIRTQKKIPANVIADKLGITKSGFSAIENGRNDVSVTRLYQIAEALGVSVPALMGLDGGVAGADQARLLALEARVKELEAELTQKELLIEFREALDGLHYMMHFCQAYLEVAELRGKAAYEEIKVAYAAVLSRARTLSGFMRTTREEKQHFTGLIEPLAKYHFPPLGEPAFETLQAYTEAAKGAKDPTVPDIYLETVSKNLEHQVGLGLQLVKAYRDQR